MKKYYLVIVLLLVSIQIPFYTTVVAQNVPEAKMLNIGDTAPELLFSPLANSDKKEIKLSDLKGKLIILDFWATWCAPCLNSIPKNDSLQKKFEGKLQFILVSSEKKEIVEGYFNNSKRINKIEVKLPSVYGTSILNRYFPHRAVPHYVWINGDGKIIAITDSHQVNVENIVKAINNNGINLPVNSDRGARTDVDPLVPFFNESLSPVLFKKEGVYGPNKIKYRAVITKYVDDLPGTGGSMNYKGRIIHTNALLSSLYRNAYSFTSGIFDSFPYSRIELNVKDRTKFEMPNDYDAKKKWINENCYISDLLLPKYYEGRKVDATNDSLRKIACEIEKINLDSFFRYESSIQKRTVNCLVLKAIDTNKLINSENYPKYVEMPGKLGAVINNRPFPFFFFKLKEWLEGPIPMVDETNYKGKVNLKIEAPLLDISAMKEALKHFGLEIVEEKRAIDFLVINDRK